MEAFGKTVRDQIGVNIHFTDPEPGEMEMLARLGVGLVRMDFFWHDTETAKGVYDFSRYDRLLTHLDRYQIRPLFILDYGHALYDDGLSPHTDAGREAFARWAVAAVTHFGGRRILWEMWNEPNGGFWKPQVNADDYAKLALTVGEALRTAAPNEIYIGPGEVGTESEFLETCFQAGLLEYWAGVSVHPYRSSNPETVTPDYQRVAALIATYAPPGRTIPILSGEWGYSVIDQETYSYVPTDALQAAYFGREILTNMENGIPVSIWYDWRNDGPDTASTEDNFGLVRHAYHPGRTPVFDPKPSYMAAQTLLDTLGDFCYDHPLPVAGSIDAHALSFARETEHRYAAWTTAPSPQSVILPLPAGRYTILGIAGNVTQTVTADKSGLPITLTGEVQFVLPSNKSIAA